MLDAEITKRLAEIMGLEVEHRFGGAAWVVKSGGSEVDLGGPGGGRVSVWNPLGNGAQALKLLEFYPLDLSHWPGAPEPWQAHCNEVPGRSLVTAENLKRCICLGVIERESVS